MEFDQAVAELDTLIVTLEREDDQRALMLLELIDAIHRPALALIAAGETEDPIARALLSMYDLAPVDERIQVEEALDEIRPYIESHGGELELLDVQDGGVHVRMSGACHGCAASAMTLRRGIEERLRERYPGFREVVAHEPESDERGSGAPLLQIERPQLLQIERPQQRQVEGLKRPVFEDAGPLADLAPGEMKAIELDAASILIANVGGEPYAFRNSCPVDGDRELPLDGGRLAGTVLVCPWHNCAYDARSGRRVDDEPGAPALAVVPIAVRDGVLKVAVNVA
jgi:Fe-S cluster biogenesis protein NfuA/nitrite reductase/ring-hydroxylating ferredoxin subunit